MEELLVTDPVRATWAIANMDMSEDSRIFLAAMMMAILNMAISRDLVLAFIAEMRDLWGGMSLEVMRHEYTTATT